MSNGNPESQAVIDQLRQYVLIKQSVSSLLMEARELLERYEGKEYYRQTQALVVKLAQDRFNLAVVGQFKRGKSSLMNAIIGKDLLPTGVLPLTSAITALSYGPEEVALLEFKGWSIKKEIPVAELPEYISERGNPGNQKGLVMAVVEVPSPFLRRGLYFIDTPGIGSARLENTQTTYDFLPEADAVIFVTSAEAPLSEAEEAFLRDIQQYVHKLFVVVNKMDLLSESESEEVLAYLRTGIEKVLSNGSVHLFPLSARTGLQAKMGSDETTLAESGLPAFEAELVSFLSGEKSQVFLISVLERFSGLLSQAKQLFQSGWQPPELQTGLKKMTAQELAQEMDALQDRLRELQKQIPSMAQKESEVWEAGEQQAGEFAQKNAPSIEISLPKNVEEKISFESKTCPICVAQENAVYQFFTHFQYELSTSDEAQRALAATHGFCHDHTWLFQQIASPQGLSQGYIAIVDQTAAELQHLKDQSKLEILSGIDRLLPATSTCAACQILRKTEDTQVRLFCQKITVPEGLEQYQRSQGLCIEHLSSVLQIVEDPQVSNALLQHQAMRLEEISEDMHSYLLKRAAYNRNLINAEEEKAWRAALVKLAKERYVYQDRNHR